MEFDSLTVRSRSEMMVNVSDGFSGCCSLSFDLGSIPVVVVVVVLVTVNLVEFEVRNRVFIFEMAD